MWSLVVVFGTKQCLILALAPSLLFISVCPKIHLFRCCCLWWRFSNPILIHAVQRLHTKCDQRQDTHVVNMRSNRNVFNWRFNALCSVKSWSSAGNAFHALGPACEKQRSPKLSRVVIAIGVSRSLASGTVYWLWLCNFAFLCRYYGTR